MAGTFCAQSDPLVNAAGHRQIQKLAERLRTEPIVTVFTSDLQRSVTTARALAESFAIPCITRPALREIYFGKREGLTWEGIEKLGLTFATQWLEAFPLPTTPGGQ